MTRNLAATAFVCAALGASLRPILAAPDALERGFVAPPASARPMTWMHWMDNNISAEGMTKDLEAIADAGLGGALIFNIARGIPDGKIIFNSPEYRAIMAHSAREAQRLGLQIGAHNCDGWSSSGGPWVKVEDSMKRIVWSETVVQGGAPIRANLPQPPTQLGFYRDIAVVAYPATENELAMDKMKPNFSASAPGFDATPLKTSILDDTAPLNAPKGEKSWLQLAYDQPFEAQSISIEHDSRNANATLLASDNGATFRKVTDLGKVRTSKGTWIFDQSFAPIAARFFRVEFSESLNLRGLEMASQPRLPAWIDRNAMGSESDDKIASLAKLRPQQFVPLDQVRVIAAKPDANGQLTTVLPSGVWRVMRFGYSTTAASNNPATVEGKGLEIDKFDRAALDKHFAAYLGQLADDIGPLTGKSFVFSEIDSYEMGGQNWTENLGEKFRAKNGYELTPFLPLLAGRFIGNAETATAVTRDFRGLVSGLMTDNYYRHFAELCRARGMKSYVEPYGNGPIDNLTVGGAADIPMGEFWMDLKFIETLKTAASAAHIYGKPVVSAEAFTSWADLNWKIHPALMKYAGDVAWTQGVNEFMFHRYAHQANTHVAPGMTMGNVGSHLDGTQTWWRNAGKAWMQYLRRGQFLLRQGVPVADVLVYVGEASPHGTPRELKPKLPDGFNFDHCDTEVLLHRIKVKGGRLVLPEGTSYRVLMLGNSENMSLQMLRRVQELAAQGAIITGPKPLAPIGYLEQRTQRAAFDALANKIWGNGKAPFNRVGKGRIYASTDWRKLFGAIGLTPDFVAPGAGKTSFIHRNLASSDIYFFLNDEEAPRTMITSFRVTDRIPELWHADTGEIERLAQFTQPNGRTQVEIALPAQGSAFVVFRQSAKRADPVVSSKFSAPNALLTYDDAGRMRLHTRANGFYQIIRKSGKIQQISVTDLPAPLPIEGAWQVDFEGATVVEPRGVNFDALADWKDHERDDIKHFSGSATYRKTVDLPANWMGSGKRTYLDLGHVEIAAEVKINGVTLPTLWKAPFVVDATDALQAGSNQIEIRVTNLWTNRLIGDAALPDQSGYDSSDKTMVDWYANNQPQPAGPRSTFTTFDFHKSDKTLLPSGLLGPVQMRLSRSVALKQ